MLDQTPCCGVDLYEGVNYPAKTARQVILDIGFQWLEDGDEEHRVAHVLFTEARVPAKRLGHVPYFDAEPLEQMPSCVRTLMRLIALNNLGNLVRTTWKVNPNSLNEVRSLVWTVNWNMTQKWLMAVPDYRNEVERLNERDEEWGMF